MTNIESLNLKHYIDCEREYTSDEMAFILSIAVITEEKAFVGADYGELIAKYREFLPIYSKVKSWLNSEQCTTKGGGND